jgi:nitrate/TMAO reductase-like tetraheme cytochrome c subunit
MINLQKKLGGAMGFKGRFSNVFFFITFITFFFVAVFALNTVSAEDVANSCIACHSKPGFRVTNKKLYNYFLDWELSLHAREGITCADCHRGNPDRTDKEEAHGKDIKRLLSPVEYEQISVTCGKCHKENAENYKKTRHYKILIKTGRLHPTPTCINCHGSINTSIPKPDTLTNICSHCHNAVTENNPEIPSRAGYLVERLSFINSYYSHLKSKGVLEKSPDFSKAADNELLGLAELWHTLELDKIQEKTLNIRTMMLKKGKELRQAE